MAKHLAEGFPTPESHRNLAAPPSPSSPPPTDKSRAQPVIMRTTLRPIDHFPACLGTLKIARKDRFRVGSIGGTNHRLQVGFDPAARLIHRPHMAIADVAHDLGVGADGAESSQVLRQVPRPQVQPCRLERRAGAQGRCCTSAGSNSCGSSSQGLLLLWRCRQHTRGVQAVDDGVLAEAAHETAGGCCCSCKLRVYGARHWVSHAW